MIVHIEMCNDSPADYVPPTITYNSSVSMVTSGLYAEGGSTEPPIFVVKLILSLNIKY